MDWKKKADGKALVLGLVCFCGVAVVSGFCRRLFNRVGIRFNFFHPVGRDVNYDWVDGAHFG